MIDFSEKDGALIFAVLVAPRAKQSEIVGAHDGALKVRISAAPIDGAANQELIKILAKFFDVPKSAVEIAAGETSKIKQIKVAGANPKKLRQFEK